MAAVFEFAARIAELASSNLNALIASAADPAKMLRLMLAEIEDSVIALGRKAKELDRGAHSFTLEAERTEAAAAAWEDKARLALSHDREDLARGALAERKAALAAAEAQRDAAAAAATEAAEYRDAVAALEAKHAETKVRLLKVLAEKQGVPTDSAKMRANTDRVLERFVDLEKRIDYSRSGTGQSLDQELAALASDAAIEAELKALREDIERRK